MPMSRGMAVPAMKMKKDHGRDAHVTVGESGQVDILNEVRESVGLF